MRLKFYRPLKNHNQIARKFYLEIRVVELLVNYKKNPQIIRS